MVMPDRVSKHRDVLNKLVEMQESPVYASRKATLLCAEQLIYNMEQEINRLKELVEPVEIKQVVHLGNDSEVIRSVDFERMYNGFLELSKTHKAFECVVSSDFSEVWDDAYRAGLKAEREITEKRIKSLEKTILDADSWLHIGDGVHLDYYHEGYGDDESVAIIEELLRSNNIKL